MILILSRLQTRDTMHVIWKVLFRLSLWILLLESLSFGDQCELCHPTVILMESGRQGWHSHLEASLSYFYLMHNVVSRKHSWIVDCCLLLAGDIAINPGLFWFPCTVCALPVRSDQCGIECDMCQKWSHTRCVGVQYQLMVNSDKFSCCCPSCVLSQLPFSNESVLDSSAIDQNSAADAVDDEPDAALYMVSDLLETKVTYTNSQQPISLICR